MHIIINIKNRTFLNPSDAGFVNEKGRSTFMESEDEARLFAEFCARKWPGHEFGVMKLACKAKASAPPVEWSNP